MAYRNAPYIHFSTLLSIYRSTPNSRRLIRVVSAILLGSTFASATSGCALFNQLKAGARVSPFIVRNQSAGAGGYGPLPGDAGVRELRAVDPLPVNLDELVLPGNDAGDASGSAYFRASKGPVARNRLQDYLLTRSEEICLVHKSDILAVSSTFNASLSGLTTILGGVGSIVTGANAARALAGTAGISNGLRDDLNENVYFNNFAGAIIRQIDAQRSQKMQNIEPKRSKDIAAYSAEAAVLDVVEYHNLCSFSEAIASLATDAKRPLTQDELTGKLQNLRVQLNENKNAIASLTAPGDKDAVQDLQVTNKILASMIQSTTLQLALTGSISAASPVVNSESNNGASVDKPSPEKKAGVAVPSLKPAPTVKPVHSPSVPAAPHN